MSRPIREAVEQLRRSLGPGESGGLTDAELLRRWVTARDEAAFEVLLWRHGPMVLGVCRRLLRRAQAVAAWLYRVAYRVALRARAAEPAEATGPPEVAVSADPAEGECRRDLREA